MTQFKFGDRVYFAVKNCIGILISIDTDKETCRVLLEDGYEICGDYEIFEPIPHPDTVRLDWLENEVKRVGYSVNFEFDGTYFHINEDGIEQESFVNLRESIDFLTLRNAK